MAHSGDSFTERLRRLEDAEQIRQLNLEYRRHLDARDLDAYGQLFTGDGEWLGGTGYGRGPGGITAMLNERLPARGSDRPAAWHLVTEPEISLDGDRAAGTVTWTWVGRGDAGTPVMRLLGHYQDNYVREHGRWRYRRRIAYTDIPYRKLELPASWADGTEPGAADDGGGAPADGDIDARLGRLEDTGQIRRLTQEYRRVLDARDLDGYGRLFAGDGEWLGGTGYGRGPAGITAMLEEKLPARSPDGPAAWHLVTEPEISLDGGRAAGTVTWTWVGRGDAGTPVMRLLGHYQDTYVREHGRWRYQRRIAHTDIPHRPLARGVWGDGQSPHEQGGHRGGSGFRPPGESTEDRLRRLEDLEQIRQLFVEYKRVLDQQDFAAYGALFAADGEFIASPQQGLQQAKGPAAIQALVEAMPGSLLGSAPGDDFHVVINPLIELDAADPDRARAEVTWLYVVKGDDGLPSPAKLGHYDDQLVREDGRWRFLRREAPTDIG